MLDEKTAEKYSVLPEIVIPGGLGFFRESCFTGHLRPVRCLVIEADPESMIEMERTHEFSGTDAHAGVDSGSASEFEPMVFAEFEDGSNDPPCWRPPGMTGLGTVGQSYKVKLIRIELSKG